jgi:predicted CXXCH cytochrome family protein
MKKYIFIIITIGIIGLVFAFPHVMISPGNLYKAHTTIQNNCLACHKPLSGTPNEKCISCHKVSEIGMKKNRLQFHQKIENLDCISCHSEHKGQNSKMAMNTFEHIFLPEKERNLCINCHNQPKNDLHNQVSNSCVSCHTTRTWKSVVPFNHNLIKVESRNNCISCHQSPKDKIHSISSNNCISCHSQVKWKPSTFNHNKFFVLDANHNVSCTSCHKTNDFKTYTCLSCHSLASIRNEHSEEGINNLDNCIRCHRSAAENEGEMNENSVIEYINKESKTKETEGNDD